MKSQHKNRRPPEELWKAIEDQRDNDEMERILALSDAELDAELVAMGFDPEKERALGPIQAQQAAAQVEAQEKEREEQRQAQSRLSAIRARRGKLDDATLRERIKQAKEDPRLPQRAAVLFRNRSTEAAKTEELESILDELEDLIETHDRKKDS
jgi:hypothetical protein